MRMAYNVSVRRIDLAVDIADIPLIFQTDEAVQLTELPIDEIPCLRRVHPFQADILLDHPLVDLRTLQLLQQPFDIGDVRRNEPALLDEKVILAEAWSSSSSFNRKCPKLFTSLIFSTARMIARMLSFKISSSFFKSHSCSTKGTRMLEYGRTSPAAILGKRCT